MEDTFAMASESFGREILCTSAYENFLNKVLKDFLVNDLEQRLSLGDLW